MPNRAEPAEPPQVQNTSEPHWPASLAVLVALSLYVTLPDLLLVGPKWILAALELALLIPLTLHSPHRRYGDPPWVRATSVTLIALINVANIAALVLLIHYLLIGGHQDPNQGRMLILSSVQIWLTNVLIFGLWYWELDRGGPTGRTAANQRHADFMFPQMSNPNLAPPQWRPNFIDYLYISVTNATAFSPTDTMPLSRIAKSLMTVQSVASLLTVALVAARAVNILS